MELKKFIDKVLIENNLNYDSKKVKDYITDKAKLEAKGASSIGISDETVREWIIAYDPNAKEDDKEKFEVKAEEKKPEPKPKQNEQLDLFGWNE